jgi:lipoprotein-anchoring transpeptidase ErfK/SrfK
MITATLHYGTSEERNIGVASSFGCSRRRSADVISLYDTVGIGARVVITLCA